VNQLYVINTTNNKTIPIVLNCTFIIITSLSGSAEHITQSLYFSLNHTHTFCLNKIVKIKTFHAEIIAVVYSISCVYLPCVLHVNMTSSTNQNIDVLL